MNRNPKITPSISDTLHAELVGGLTRGTLTDTEIQRVAEIVRSVLGMVAAEQADPGIQGQCTAMEIQASRWRLVRDQVHAILHAYFAEEVRRG